MMVDEWTPIYCKNCGHESHCGINKMSDFRGSRGNGAIEGQIEVCKYCRCDKCVTPDWGQEILMQKKCLSCGHDCHCATVDCIQSNRGIRTKDGLVLREVSKKCICTKCKCLKNDKAV